MVLNDGAHLPMAYPALIWYFDEVMAFASRGEEFVCLTDHHLLRGQDAKLGHVTVAPCSNAIGDAAIH
jgi:hypothetical protein